jgi:dipeptidyl aminopeptidase/acylaminoacyl peptidase
MARSAYVIIAHVTRLPAALLLLLLSTSTLAQPQARRPMQVADLDRLREVRDPQVSPDGKWVAYTVVAPDTERDRDNADIWMSSWEGREHLQLTSSPDRETQPRFSPDGTWLAFLSARTQGDESAPSGAQIWKMHRQGGEAVRLTGVKGGISDFQWSPDSTRIAFVAMDSEVEPDESAKDGAKKTKPPLVIDRYHFKRDVDGYLGARRSHLYLLTLDTGAVAQLTSGVFDDRHPAWSPDGKRLAFTSKRGADPDRSDDSNVFVMDAQPGSPAQALTTWTGGDDATRPLWSPDGRTIAYLQDNESPQFYYPQNRLAVVPAAGGPSRVLTPTLDRPVESPLWSPDGQSLLFVIVDDRSRHLARIPATGGRAERVVTGRRVVRSLAANHDGRLAALATTAHEAAEVHAIENGALRRLSTQNDAWLAGLALGPVDEVSFRTKDGVDVNGLLVKPADFQPGRRYPLVLYIHGGPNSQDQHELDVRAQVFAAHGYVVLLANYRGSAGRSQAFQAAMQGDWGNKEVVDLLAGVDHLIKAGIADPDRLLVGGWSYGGILTNYLIATDTRFKAAVSGAGSSLQASMYGTDQYIVQYAVEMGHPWKRPEAWTRVSYPFFKADRIKTPTLFMGGERDFNVPIAGSEQMYQALKAEGVETQLVIYPGQYHSLSVPSYRRDRLQRFLDWYAKHLPARTAPVPSEGEAGRKP